jgi:hypothetical protein
MKRKALFAFAILTVLSLAIAAFAYGGLTTAPIDDKASCCKKDSCPMVKHDGEHKSGEHAKGEHKCCGDSCPMKSGDHKSGDHAKMEGHNCCGDSCPMKKKEGTATAVSTTEEGKSCCDNCECCKGKEKKDTAAV